VVVVVLKLVAVTVAVDVFFEEKMLDFGGVRCQFYTF
jgi:hypothetical protein